MNITYGKVFVCLMLMLGVSAAQADELSVLLKFDNTGHHVVQLINAKSSDVAKAATAQPDGAGEQPDMNSVVAEMQPRIATLVWTDAQGHLRSITHEPDPRISHSPGHIAGLPGSRFSEEKGAWLVSGPDTAVTLTILLPADFSLGLGFEQWELSIQR